MSELTSHTHIPLELMAFLNKMNDNISDVRDRLIRIESQDHTDTIKLLRKDLEIEKDARQKLELRVQELTTRVAPMIAAVVLVLTIAGEYLVKVL